MIPEEHFEELQKLVDLHNYGVLGIKEKLAIVLGIPIIIMTLFYIGYIIASAIYETIKKEKK